MMMNTKKERIGSLSSSDPEVELGLSPVEIDCCHSTRAKVRHHIKAVVVALLSFVSYSPFSVAAAVHNVLASLC